MSSMALSSLTASGRCYHCGATSPADSAFTSMLGGSCREFCCAGCQAMAETIHGEVCEACYARRVAAGAKPEDGSINISDRSLAYADPVLAAPFVREIDGVAEFTLRLEKIRCAAWVWLNEQR